MKLVINLFHKNDIEGYNVSSLKGAHFIDLQGENSKVDFVVPINIEAMEGYHSIYSIAVKKFTSFVSKVSDVTINGTHIRSFQSNGLPPFWLTSLAEKHYFHWLMKFFLLREFISKKSDFFNSYEEIVFLIPAKRRKVKVLLAAEFRSFTLSYHYSSKVEQPVVLLFIKITIKGIISFLRRTTPILSYSEPRAIFICRNKVTTYTKQYLENLRLIVDMSVEELQVITIDSIIKNSDNNLEYKFPNLFWKCRPSLILYLKFKFLTFKRLILLNFIKEEELSLDNIIFPSNLVLDELKDVVVNKEELLIYNKALLSYKSEIKESPFFFYEDEFYPSGRAISFGLAGLSTFGIQHSMVGNEQSVYIISDRELESKVDDWDHLPTPSKFITWGDIFKNSFLSNNSLDQSFIVSAGNPTYIMRSNLVGVNLKRNRLTVLYCLTREEFFHQEKQIIKSNLHKFKNFDLVVRYHPLWHFDAKVVIDFFQDVNVIFSDCSDIFEDINNADLIITSGHSGVWLDGIVAKKPVIRIVTFIQDDFQTNGLIYNVKDENEFKRAIESIERNGEISLCNNILYLEKDRWEELFINNG